GRVRGASPRPPPVAVVGLHAPAEPADRPRHAGRFGAFGSRELHLLRRLAFHDRARLPRPARRPLVVAGGGSGIPVEARPLGSRRARGDPSFPPLEGGQDRWHRRESPPTPKRPSRPHLRPGRRPWVSGSSASVSQGKSPTREQPIAALILAAQTAKLLS